MRVSYARLVSDFLEALRTLSGPVATPEPDRIR